MTSTFGKDLYYRIHSTSSTSSTQCEGHMYRDEIYSLQNLLSRTQAGPGKTVKKEQEEISPNHVQRINLISVFVKRCTI